MDKMIFYISSQFYQTTLSSTIKEQEIYVVDSMVERNLDFYKYIKTNINTLSSNIDIYLFDLSALTDMDEDILKAITMLRTLDVENKKRIIIFAPSRVPGDKLLSDIFALGIQNIIATHDHLIIKQQLITCLSTDGKSFKDALEFKDVRENVEIIGKERLKVVSRVLIGITGGQGRIGVTHSAIMFANFLRKKGFLVALVERNHSGDLERVRIGHAEKLHGTYYSMGAIDYYPEVFDKEQLRKILEKNYNFILYDYGTLDTCNKEEFLKCHKKLVLLGCKTWEVHYLNRILKEFSLDILKQLTLCINFVEPSYRQYLKKAFKYPDGETIKPYFLEYHSDAFSANENEFAAAEEILEEYMLSPKKSEKKGLLPFRLGKKKKEGK